VAELKQNPNSEESPKNRLSSLPNPNYPLIVAAGFISLLIHFSSYISLEPYSRHLKDRQIDNDQNKIKIRYVSKKPKPDKSIIEAPLKKTEAPETPTHLGVNDHKTKKETRLKKQKTVVTKAANAGRKGTTKKPKSKQKQIKKPQKKNRPSTIAGSVIIPDRPVPRNAYESFLSNNFDELQGEVDAGYQDFVDDKIAEGDRIDLNTKEYRYIGYFTILRKSIELVWNYPAAAARKGLQGTVQLEFTIAKDGEVSQIKVLNSSGYYILDRAIVNALKLASPFAPLPEGFGKERIVITGSFNYVLQGYASGH